MNSTDTPTDMPTDEPVDEPVDESTEDQDTPRSTSSLGSRVLSALPWVLVLAALGVAVFSTWQWQQLATEADTRDRVELAATQFMTLLTNWDTADGLEQTREKLREAGTGTFLEELDQFFEPLTGQLAADVTSTGRVEDVFVEQVEGDQAAAFTVTVQTVTQGEQRQTSVRRAALELTRVDGRWLVEGVRLLADEPQAGAEPAEEATP